MEVKKSHFTEILELRINDYLKSINDTDLMVLIERFMGYRLILWSFPIVLWVINLLLAVFPFHSLDIVPVLYVLTTTGTVGLVLSIIVNRMLINLTTRRTDNNQDERIGILMDLKQQMDIQGTAIFGGIAGLVISFTVIPYLQFLMDNPNPGLTRQQVELIVGPHGLFLNILLFFIPVIFSVFIYSLISSDQATNQREIEEWMRNYEYHNTKIKDVLNDGKSKQYESNIDIGTSLETGDEVMQTVVSRRQNSVIYGPIGSGKSSTIFIPWIKQDISSYLMFIRDYKKASKDPTWMKPHGLASRYLNGFNVIDPTNDLCREVYELCMELGVPKSKVWWFDPENKNTPAINLLRGPVEKAAENVANIINGLKGGNNDFFAQSERTHLKNYIYLVKLTAVMDRSIASFEDLIDMYNDVELVWDKVQVLDKYCETLLSKMNTAKDDFTAFPEGHDKRSHYLELKDKYAVAWQTDQWFHRTIQPVMVGKNVRIYADGPHQGHVMHYDVQAEFIHGLVNILDDISKNIPIRRVLFRDSGDFNLDDFLKNGGILLCSTAKAAVGDQLAEILGQVYTLAFQAATYRRVPNAEPMHPLYGDEFPDYLSESFKDYAAQARKYNVPIIIAAQSPAQLAYKYGVNYFDTLMSVMLTRITFGDMGREDAEKLAPLFGEHTQTTFSSNEQEIRLVSGQDNNRKMVGTRKETLPNITPSQIMGLERFTIAVRTPGQHSSDMFNRVRVKRVTAEDIAEDPLRFSMDDLADRASFKYMEAHQVHDNPDFDEIDKEIMASLEQAASVKTEPPSSPAEEEVDSQEIIKMASLAFKSKTGSDEGQEDENAGEKVDELFDDEDDEFASSGVKTNLTSIGKNGVRGKIHFDNSPIVPSHTDELSDEETFAAVDSFVRGNANKSSDFADVDALVGMKKKNEPSEDTEGSQKAPEHESKPNGQLTSKNAQSEPQRATQEDTRQTENEDEQSMMHIGKDDKIVVDDKDREVMQVEQEGKNRERIHDYKKEALKNLVEQIEVITSNPITGTSQKIQELSALEVESRGRLLTLFPYSIDKVIDSTIGAAILKQRDNLKLQHPAVTNHDSFYTGRQKVKDAQKNRHFQDDFAAVMAQMDDISKR